MANDDVIDESWRKVEGFPDYSVSSCGQIRRDTQKPGTRPGKIRSAYVNAEGYLRISLSRDGRSVQFRVHRLVADAFLPKRECPSMEINHKNGVKTDNRVENLEWVSRSENIQHALQTGLYGVGEMVRWSKLTDDSVARIRDLRRTVTARELADRFGVSRNTINDICQRRTWKHVP